MRKILTAILAGSLAAATILGGCASNQPSQNSSSSAVSQESKTATTAAPVEDTTVVTTGDKIHINDNTLGDIWITELDGVKKNTLNNDNFTSDANFKYYSENGKPASMEGVDVSSFSGEIDWAKVKNAGVDFAMVRLGGRGYGAEGGMYADDKALSNIEGARKAGIKVGAYFYSQAISNAEAEEEADYCKQILGDTKLDFPLAFDWEIVKDDNARTDNVSATQATECAVAFCEKAKSYGFTPMVYSPSRELYFKYDLSRLKDYEIWYVEYANLPVFYYQFSMWQYSETGSVDGIEGSVDLNICFTGIADYAK